MSLLSFELIHFRYSFCYKIENNLSFQCKILSHVVSLGTNLIFLVSLGIAEISIFSKLSVYSEVVLLKTFLQHIELRFCCKYSRTYEVL